MKKLLILICLFSISLCIPAQSESFEGSLVYRRKFYDGAEGKATFDSSATTKMIQTIKGSLSLVELSGQDSLLEGKNYSIITDSDKKESTLLAHMGNRNVAVKFDSSYFNSSKLYTIASTKDNKTLEIAGLSCHAGYVLLESDLSNQDTLKIWYSTSYKAIPCQFNTNSGPGLIVSIQQDANTYWELTEIRKEKVETTRFIIPTNYTPITESELRDYLFSLEQFEIVDDGTQEEIKGYDKSQEKKD